MNIQNLLKSMDGMTNITLSVTPADLKEFALTIIEELRASEQTHKQTRTSKEEPGRLMTQAEAASYLGKSKGTLWRWKKNGFLVPTAHIGSSPMYSKACLDAIMNDGREQL